MTRIRTMSSNNPTIQCGEQHFTTNGGATWTPNTVLTYNAANNGRSKAYGKRCGDLTHPGPPYYTGGPLGIFEYSDDFGLVGSGTYYGWVTPAIGYRYKGGFVSLQKPGFSSPLLNPSSLGLGVSMGSLDSHGDISSYGATGWNKFRPGNPTADLGVFLGELRDVPRMLSGTAKYFHNLWKSMGGSSSAFAPKAVADAWLNTQFGWMPFISDIRKFYKAYTTLDSRLEMIKRDNGKWCRRHGTVSTSVGDANVISQSATATAHWPSLTTYHYKTPGVTGSHIIRDQYSRTVWFEGSFRYWIPDIESVTWKRRAIAEIFGVMPCPSLVWNLLPWSWLVDWGTNVGDVISNMSTGWADNLAARYAYVMGTTSMVRTVDSTCALKGGTLQNSWTFPIKWKTRVGASPFGFGLSESNFSPRQWSILAALGISRVK